MRATPKLLRDMIKNSCKAQMLLWPKVLSNNSVPMCSAVGAPSSNKSWCSAHVVASSMAPVMTPLSLQERRHPGLATEHLLECNVRTSTYCASNELCLASCGCCWGALSKKKALKGLFAL
mmetsp:Transcript_18743/g.41812  ORF Transcript_18743/g.41812 Transcript_18743/m.41812 type:complete len:120 (-) Transcript_18743:1121-1480(-)